MVLLRTPTDWTRMTVHTLLVAISVLAVLGAGAMLVASMVYIHRRSHRVDAQLVTAITENQTALGSLGESLTRFGDSIERTTEVARLATEAIENNPTTRECNADES